MERFRGLQEHTSEQSPERIHLSEEILAAISEYAEGYAVTRELSDEKGIYLQEVQSKGEKEGEIVEYQYMRKGRHSTHNHSDQTAISVIYYQDGMSVGGERVAIFDDQTGEWTKS